MLQRALCCTVNAVHASCNPKKTLTIFTVERAWFHVTRTHDADDDNNDDDAVVEDVFTSRLVIVCWFFFRCYSHQTSAIDAKSNVGTHAHAQTDYIAIVTVHSDSIDNSNSNVNQ